MPGRGKVVFMVKAGRARKWLRCVVRWLPAAIAAVWLCSGWVYAGVALRGPGSEVSVSVDLGVVRVVRLIHIDEETSPARRVQVFCGARKPPWRWRFVGSWPAWWKPALNGGAEVPLWAAFVVSGVPAGVGWWKRKKFGPGKCAKCGYDLAGLPGNVCPECGGGTGAVAGPRGHGMIALGTRSGELAGPT